MNIARKKIKKILTTEILKKASDARMTIQFSEHGHSRLWYVCRYP